MQTCSASEKTSTVTFFFPLEMTPQREEFIVIGEEVCEVASMCNDRFRTQ
jgi:hypothetical protein